MKLNGIEAGYLNYNRHAHISLKLQTRSNPPIPNLNEHRVSNYSCVPNRRAATNKCAARNLAE